MRSIVKYLFKRIIGIIPVLIIVSFVSFALLNLGGGDPAEIILTSQGTVVTPELLERVRADMGLDKPFFTQYITWVNNVMHGNLGNSYATGISVVEELKEHLPYTFKDIRNMKLFYVFLVFLYWLLIN